MMPESHHDQATAWHPYTVETAVIQIDSRIHVWRVGLDDVEARIADALSDDELARADRFCRLEDRRRFIATRGVLRTILADLLECGQDPKGRALRFGYGPAGKPVLLDDPLLHFNVSHSEDLAVIAVTRAGEVGIDIERQRRMNDMDQIARVVFNEAERAAMLGCPAMMRESVFYRIWTRKEALLKAMGNGLPALGDPDAAALLADPAVDVADPLVLNRVVPDAARRFL